MANDPRQTRGDPYTSIFETSIEAFGAELTRFFNDRLTQTFLVKQQGNLDDLLKQKQNLKPPFFTYHLSDSALFDEGVSNQRLVRQGMNFGGPKARLDTQGRPVNPNENYTRLNPVNVEVNINVSYHCDFAQQLEFIQAWSSLATKPVKFIINYKGIEVPCVMILDKSITFADIDFEDDSLVECQTNCALRTWIASEGKTRPISRYTVNGKIGDLADENEAEAARRYTEFSITIDDEGIEEIIE